MTDESEVVTAAVNEKICPEFSRDSHSKEVKMILHINVFISGFPRRVIHYFRLREKKNVLNELYAIEIFVMLPSIDFSKHVILF